MIFGNILVLSLNRYHAPTRLKNILKWYVRRQKWDIVCIVDKVFPCFFFSVSELGRFCLSFVEVGVYIKQENKEIKKSQSWLWRPPLREDDKPNYN